MICLLPHCAYLSETSRMLELHRALTELGLPVRVATHGGPHERLLAGIPYDVLGPGLSASRAARFVGSAVGLGDPGQSMYDDDEIRSYVQTEAEYFRAHGITVAVTGFTLTALLSSRLAGVQVITEHAGSFVPPVFERYLPPDRKPARIEAYCSGFNRVAESLGIEGIPSLAALLLGDLSLVPEVAEVLSVSATELAAWTPDGDPGYRPNSRLAAVGPLFAHLDLPLPDRVQKFLSHPGPTIYLAMTSTPPTQVRAAIAELSSLDLRILVAGTIHDLSDLATDRILVGATLPSHLVMPQVDLAITTGGQGSVQTAMASGTPLLGIPLHIEQDLNVALVERLGAARHATPTDNLATLAAQMLDNRSHAAAAERIQKLYAAVDGPAQAAEAIALAAPETS
ncbi:nucleotide disphospho-sugar-binding domain-containing protein [Streptomyces sp. SID13031]|uniref:nucleotide disphospho-sugar-binding domain-containing protein n=1 Tax=Streptomyces sp. SID13031 TaxID=2706046 RepID=UPI0013CA39FF|nr:glycosyltransferase family 1 protein [Streptomyces sp. SID13031]